MSSEIRVNTVNEGTSASGVTIDGVLIKDGLVDGKDVSTLANSVAFTEVDAYVLNTDLTADEISEIETRNTAIEDAKAAKVADAVSGNQKLLDLGLTQAEATALTGFKPE